MNNEIEFIDQMITRLKSIKSSINKKNKLSEKALNMNPGMYTPKQIDKANVNLNWECMNVDKLKTDFARAFKGSNLDVYTDEKEYRPSGFHNYKY